MTISKRSITLLLVLIGIVTWESVYANGINPPRPAGQSTVWATCIERSPQLRRDMIRAVVKSKDGTSKELTFRIDEIPEQLLITDIESITLSTSAIDTDGFVKAVLVRRYGSEGESVELQVKSGDSNIILQGYDQNGSRVTAALYNCAVIAFNSDTSDTFSHRSQTFVAPSATSTIVPTNTLTVTPADLPAATPVVVPIRTPLPPTDLTTITCAATAITAAMLLVQAKTSMDSAKAGFWQAQAITLLGTLIRQCSSRNSAH